MKKMLLAGLLLSGSLLGQTRSLEWGTVQNQWTPQFEKKYSEFVNILGKARARGFCTTTHNCLINPKANPFYYKNNPAKLQVRSDCADLPFVLRSYFAWMNHLPFSFPSWPVKVLPPELEKVALQIEGFDAKVLSAQKILQGHKKDLSNVERQIEQTKNQLSNTPRVIEEDNLFEEVRRNELRDQLKEQIKQLKRQRRQIKKITKNDSKRIKNLLDEKADMKKDLAKRSKKYSKRDIRYTPYGARIVKRISATSRMTINHVVDEVNNKVSTASYRSRADKFDQGKNYRDFYPVRVNRSAIVPGTVLYDPSGHIAVVYEVTKDGRILMIDAHPDQSLTHISYGKKFSRSSIQISGGFMNWRPVKYNNGEFIPTPNSKLANYSLVQFTGSTERDPDRINYKAAEFYYRGEKVGFYDYVRSNMFIGRVRYNPLNELEERVGELCEDLKARNSAVSSAITHKISEKKHPRKLPKNIYGTSGEWEEFSTPSRDARFKALFLETQSMVRRYLKMERDGDVKISYDGDNLAYDMKRLYQRKAKRCKIHVAMSTGQNKTFDLLEVEKRLFDLSFDPYHCVELRWGLKEVLEKKSKEKRTVRSEVTPEPEARGWFSRRDRNEQEEAEAAALEAAEQEVKVDEDKGKSVCGGRTKIKWYEREYRLRNQVNRDYKEEMDVGLLGLRLSKLGVKNKPYLNISKVISNYLN